MFTFIYRLDFILIGWMDNRHEIKFYLIFIKFYLTVSFLVFNDETWIHYYTPETKQQSK